MDERASELKQHPAAGASYREAKREEPLGCLGSFCAMLGVTPARMKSKRSLAREADAGEPRVIRVEDGERGSAGSGRSPGDGAGG